LETAASLILFFLAGLALMTVTGFFVDPVEAPYLFSLTGSTVHLALSSSMDLALYLPLLQYFKAALFASAVSP